MDTLRALLDVDDISSVCPVKAAGWPEMAPITPLAPVPVEEPAEGWPEPRHWEYRVC